MPSFGLVPQDALDIAAHLLDFQDSDPRNGLKLKPVKVDAAQAKAGAEIFAVMNCASCHETKIKTPPRQSRITRAAAWHPNQEGISRSTL